MKRIISIFLSIIIISLSLLTVHANTPAAMHYVVQRYFKQIYAHYDDAENLSFTNSSSYIKTDSETGLDYMLIEYNCKNAVQEPYFNRFGSNNKYYECSQKTNLLYESGVIIYVGNHYLLPDTPNGNFYSLREIASTNPEIIDKIIERQITQRVGYIGDADCDGKVTVIDATTIQRHLAQIEALTVELSSDIDDDGCVDITDATMLQLQLAEIE